MSEVSGQARYGVIGHPIEHSLSPLIHTLFAQQTDEALTYDAIDVPPAALGDTLDGAEAKGLRGLNVTVPHKQNVLRHCKHLTERARMAGAANTLSLSDGRWHGDTTDGPGLNADLQALDIDVRDQSVLLIGAGGSAYSVLADLLGAGPDRVIVANRTLGAAQTLCRHFAKLGDVVACSLDRIPRRRFALVINATSATLQRARPAIPPGCVRDAHCYDLMYAKDGTIFTDWSFDNGARSVHTGIGMLVEQAALSFEIWRGVAPVTMSVRAHLRDALGFTV